MNIVSENEFEYDEDEMAIYRNLKPSYLKKKY